MSQLSANYTCLCCAPNRAPSDTRFLIHLYAPIAYRCQITVFSEYDYQCWGMTSPVCCDNKWRTRSYFEFRFFKIEQAADLTWKHSGQRWNSISERTNHHDSDDSAGEGLEFVRYLQYRCAGTRCVTGQIEMIHTNIGRLEEIRCQANYLL